MAKVALIDYLRLCGLSRRVISVDLPRALMARKGTRGRWRAEAALRRELETILCEQSRRPYRGEVVVHLGIFGMKMAETRRTVKALLDSMQGPLFADDSAVALLDVTAASGAPGALIQTCSVGEYADAYDILSSARGPGPSWLGRDDEDWPNPWAHAPELDPAAELELEVVEDNLAFAEADGDLLPSELRRSLIEQDRRTIAELRINAALGTPYLPIDRPGPPGYLADVWIEGSTPVGRPATMAVPAPSGEEGSWTALVHASLVTHLRSWGVAPTMFAATPLSFDIAIGENAAAFDVDNLAYRVLRATREAIPGF